MTFAIALALTASGPAMTRDVFDSSMRASTLHVARTEARASVTIMQPEAIDFSVLKARGERAKIRRDDRGTTWLEFI